MNAFSFFGGNLPAAGPAGAHAESTIGVGAPAPEGGATPAAAAATESTCPCLLGCRSYSEQHCCRNSDDTEYYACFCMHCDIILH
ncbi:MAG: hypothetical protein WAM42_13795 [Candidatus Nitrosopolaris sp.]